MVVDCSFAHAYVTARHLSSLKTAFWAYCFGQHIATFPVGTSQAHLRLSLYFTIYYIFMS